MDSAGKAHGWNSPTNQLTVGELFLAVGMLTRKNLTSLIEPRALEVDQDGQENLKIR